MNYRRERKRYFSGNLQVLLATVITVVLSACVDYKNADPYLEYSNGNYDAAKTLFKPAAEKGDFQAMTYLAAIYQLEREYDSAIALYSTAAKNNYAPAQYNLAILLRNGKFIERDIEQAYGWFHLAAQQGHTKAKAQLSLMMSQLTPNQTMRAKADVEAKLVNN